MNDNDKLAGVVGGMGPGATIDFMSRVLAATAADVDQQHVRMIVEHNPRVPSRQQAMLGQGESPGPTLAAMAARLETAGADFIVMPCNLAHAWQSDVEAAISIPFISIVDESVQSAMSQSTADNPIGLMTTPGCFSSGLYQRAFKKCRLPFVVQSDEELAATMTLVQRIKAGDVSNEVSSALRSLANQLIQRGAYVLIAACTELPMVLRQSMFDIPLVSTTDVLAKATVKLAVGST